MAQLIDSALVKKAWREWARVLGDEDFDGSGDNVTNALADALNRQLAAHADQGDGFRPHERSSEVLRLAERVGESLRRDMLARVPSEAYDFMASLPAETWTLSAASLLSEVYADIAGRESVKREQQ